MYSEASLNTDQRPHLPWLLLVPAALMAGIITTVAVYEVFVVPGRLAQPTPCNNISVVAVTSSDGSVKAVVIEDELRRRPSCTPRPTLVKVYEELDGHDTLQDMDLITTEVNLLRCPFCNGLCYGHNRCQPSQTMNITQTIKFLQQGHILQVERQFGTHVKCACQGWPER